MKRFFAVRQETKPKPITYPGFFDDRALAISEPARRAGRQVFDTDVDFFEFWPNSVGSRIQPAAFPACIRA
jgi:hypothetical protein